MRRGRVVGCVASCRRVSAAGSGRAFWGVGNEIEIRSRSVLPVLALASLGGNCRSNGRRHSRPPAFLKNRLHRIGTTRFAPLSRNAASHMASTGLANTGTSPRVETRRAHISMACSRPIPTSTLRSWSAGRAAPSTPAPITFTASVLRRGRATFSRSAISRAWRRFGSPNFGSSKSLLQDKLKVRIGSLAADSEFFISENAALFLNGTFGWPGATAANMAAGGPGYPLASLGVRVQYAPTDNLTILAAVFNGSPG